MCGVGTHSKRFLRKMIVWRPQLTCAISVHFLSSADLTQDVSVIYSALATCFGFYCLRNMSVSLLLWNCQPKINANAVSHSFTSAMISGLCFIWKAESCVGVFTAFVALYANMIASRALKWPKRFLLSLFSSFYRFFSIKKLQQLSQTLASQKC